MFSTSASYDASATRMTLPAAFIESASALSDSAPLITDSPKSKPRRVSASEKTTS